MRRRDFLCAIAGAPLIAGASPRPAQRWSAPGRREPVLLERWSWAMGQAVRLRLFCLDEDAGLEAAQAAFAELRRVEALLSRFDEGSALSELNRQAGGRSWHAPAELVAVLREAARLRDLTRGAFDVAVEPLLRVWGFHRERETAPSPQELAEAQEAVNSAVVRIGACSVHLPARHTRLDLGGIGVGYGLDRAAAVLQTRGVVAALLDVSGDLFALGAPPGREGWLVDIVDSDWPARRPVTVTLRDRALATSAARGAVVRFGPAEQGHILNPRDASRRPVIRQATVVASTGTVADALSTAAVVTGRTAPGADRSWLVS